MRWLLPPLDVQVVVARPAVDRGRGESRPKVGHRCRDTLQLRGIELVEDADEELCLEHLDIPQQLPTGGGDPDEDDATIAGDADPFHEPALLDPVDEAGRG